MEILGYYDNKGSLPKHIWHLRTKLLALFLLLIGSISRGDNTDSKPPQKEDAPTSPTSSNSTNKNPGGDETFTDARQIKIPLTGPLEIRYRQDAWNQDPLKPDRSYFLVRNLVNDTIFVIELVETSGNSNVFTAQVLPQQTASSLVTLEFYLPLKNKILNSENLSYETGLIRKGLGLRKPYFYRIENGNKVITIYDSKSEALEAYRYFIRTGQSRDLLNPNILENQAQGMMEGPWAPRLKQVAEIEGQLDRSLRLESEKQMKLSEKEIAQRKALAEEKMQQGLALYQQDQYQEAIKLFEEGLKLDPTNRRALLEMGATYYRLDMCEKAIAYLNLSETDRVDEKQYFLGSCYLKLQRHDLAYEAFKSLRNSPKWKGASYFYLGLIDFQNENWSQARENFYKTLETSQDEDLDQAANAYLKQAEQMIELQEQRKKQFTLTGTLGFQYNSNILSIAPNALPTDLNGYRVNYGFSGEWRPVFNQKNEFLVQAQISDLSSFDSNMQKKTVFNNYDPLTFQIQFPYRWKGMFFDSSSLVSTSPFFRSLQMDPLGTGSRSELLSSVGIMNDLSLQANDRIFSLYALELRKDQFYATTTPDNDQNALFMGLSSTQIILPLQGESYQWLLELNLGFNQAQGRDQRYQQLLLGGGFMRPGFWGELWIAKLQWTYRNFFEHTTGRNDQFTNLQFLAQKKLSSVLQASALISYGNNQSNFSSAAFDQWLLMGQLVWQTRF